MMIRDSGLLFLGPPCIGLAYACMTLAWHIATSSEKAI